MKTVSRETALALGLKRYFTGEPCKHGHVVERLVGNWNCVSCENADQRRAYVKNPEKAHRWAKANPEKARAAARRRQKANPAKSAAKVARRRALRLQQTCRCCTSEMFSGLYQFAAAMGGDHIDHRTPLALGGWHCMSNLQVLTAEQHKEKTRSDYRRIVDAKLRARSVRTWTAPLAA